MNELKLTLSKKELAIFNSALNDLEDIDKKKAVSRAMREGAKVIIAQGKSNLAERNRRRKGNLAHSFGSNLKSRWKKIYSGFRRPQGAAAHLVDRGTKERWTKKGAYRGRVIGSFFWTEAVMMKGNEAIQALLDSIINEINKTVK